VILKAMETSTQSQSNVSDASMKLGIAARAKYYWVSLLGNIATPQAIQRRTASIRGRLIRRVIDAAAFGVETLLEF
jgi:transposase-like protein